MALHEFNQTNFDSDVLQSALPVLVDFWAPWCSPCRALAPTVEKLASENSEQFLVGKLNVDESPDIAGRYSIMSIPTLLLFVNGQVVEQIVGLTTKDKIMDKVKTYL